MDILIGGVTAFGLTTFNFLLTALNMFVHKRPRETYLKER